MVDIGSTRLFRGIPAGVLVGLLGKVRVRNKEYSQGEMIAFEGDACTSIGIVLDGSIAVYQLRSTGKRMIIENLVSGDIFGEVVIFSDQNTYPASIEAVENSHIAFIFRENVLLLCSLSTAF